MENLAGRGWVDSKISKELSEAKVGAVVHDFPLGTEVKTSVTGKLGNFEFTRAWYYWAVKGEVPIKVAQELYEDPIGRKDVRVVGHCACPSPEEWVEHYDANGMRLSPKSQEKEILDVENNPNSSELMMGLAKSVRERVRFVDNPEKEAYKSIIPSYHIDTQEGLNFFINTLIKHGLVPEEVKPQ